jgi:hypothetical protein
MPSASAEMLAASTASGVMLNAVLATSMEVPETCTVSRATAIELELAASPEVVAGALSDTAAL